MLHLAAGLISRIGIKLLFFLAKRSAWRVANEQWRWKPFLLVKLTELQLPSQLNSLIKMLIKIYWINSIRDFVPVFHIHPLLRFYFKLSVKSAFRYNYLPLWWRMALSDLGAIFQRNWRGESNIDQCTRRWLWWWWLPMWCIPGRYMTLSRYRTESNNHDGIIMSLSTALALKINSYSKLCIEVLSNQITQCTEWTSNRHWNGAPFNSANTPVLQWWR